MRGRIPSRLVHQDSEARWSISDLPPGDYMLQVNSQIEDRGNPQALPSTYKDAFAIRANETTMADVVLSGGSKVWVKVAVVVVVAVAAAFWSVHEEMKDWHPLGGNAFH